MDDPGTFSLAELTRPGADYFPIRQQPSGGDAPGMPGQQQFYQASPTTMAFLAKAKELGVDPNMPIGPGGRNAQGLAYSWLPYDPAQGSTGIGRGESHTKFGPTYDDPVWGKLQSTYTEPSKSKAARDRASMLAFGAAVAAITGGAGSMLLGPMFSAATQYGMTGSLDPKALAIQAGMSMIPGGLAGIDPSLASAYKIGTTALGAANVANQARKGNYDPALNAGVGIGLKELTGGLG